MAAFELEVGYKLAEAQNSDSMIVLVSNEENECKEGQYKSNVVRVVMKDDVCIKSIIFLKLLL